MQHFQNNKKIATKSIWAFLQLAIVVGSVSLALAVPHILHAATTADTSIATNAQAPAKPIVYTPLTPIPGLQSVGTGADFIKFLNAVFVLSVVVAAIIAVVVIAFSGLQYMTSGSVPVKGDAKKHIWNAVIGLIIILGSFVILYTINPQIVNVIIPEIHSVVTQGGNGTRTCSDGSIGCMNWQNTEASCKASGTWSPRLCGFTTLANGNSVANPCCKISGQTPVIVVNPDPLPPTPQPKNAWCYIQQSKLDHSATPLCSFKYSIGDPTSSAKAEEDCNNALEHAKAYPAPNVGYGSTCYDLASN